MSDDARIRKGQDVSEEVIGARIPADGVSPLVAAGRDFVFAEVWSRPGLDRRSRRWITLACVAAARSPQAMRTYLRAALDSGDITMAELREFVLQFAVFQGFPKAIEIDLMLNEMEAGD
jgi:4-carboxymuconolactone decarboxylase